jgi:cytochrome c-type biogenesis protein CcmH/NrfG
MWLEDADRAAWGSSVRDATGSLGSVLDRRRVERSCHITARSKSTHSTLTMQPRRITGPSGQSEPALPARRATQADPEYAEAYSNLGSALIGARRLPEAIRALETSLALDPNSPDTHNNLGIALAPSGRMAEAAREFETALRIYPGHVNARRNLDRLAAMRR